MTAPIILSSRANPAFTPVDQTRFGRGEGNCFAACVATITGLDLDTLTEQFCMWIDGGTYDDEGVWTQTPGEEHWYDRAVRVMRGHGFDLTYDTAVVPSGYSIASGPAARGLLHSTVAFNGVVCHDPHPSRAGLIDITDWISVKPL